MYQGLKNSTAIKNNVTKNEQETFPPKKIQVCEKMPSISNSQEKANQIIMRQHLNPLKVTIVKKNKKRQTKTDTSDSVNKGGFLYIVGGNINEYSQNVSMQILQLITEVLHNPTGGGEITVSKDTCTPMFTKVLFTVAQHQPR